MTTDVILLQRRPERVSSAGLKFVNFLAQRNAKNSGIRFCGQKELSFLQILELQYGTFGMRRNDRLYLTFKHHGHVKITI